MPKDVIYPHELNIVRCDASTWVQATRPPSGGSSTCCSSTCADFSILALFIPLNQGTGRRMFFSTSFSHSTGGKSRSLPPKKCPRQDQREVFTLKTFFAAGLNYWRASIVSKTTQMQLQWRHTASCSNQLVKMGTHHSSY